MCPKVERPQKVNKIERDLMSMLPKKEWTRFSRAMIFHGRRICAALKPAYPACPLQTLCPKIGL